SCARAPRSKVMAPRVSLCNGKPCRRGGDDSSPQRGPRLPERGTGDPGEGRPVVRSMAQRSAPYPPWGRRTVDLWGLCLGFSHGENWRFSATGEDAPACDKSVLPLTTERQHGGTVCTSQRRIAFAPTRS